MRAESRHHEIECSRPVGGEELFRLAGSGARGEELTAMTETPQKAEGGPLGRALRLRCPRCGGAPMFAGVLRMHPACAACGLRFEREAGFFLGSIYLNYGLTAVVNTVTWVVLRFGLELPAAWILPGLLLFSLTFPLFFHRYARALWLSLDQRFDPQRPSQPPPAPSPPPAHKARDS